MNVLRKTELIVLGVGLLIALAAVGWGSEGAFQANMGSLKGTARFLAFFTTLVSLLIVGAIVIAPYAVLFVLSKQIAGDSSPTRFRVAGFVVSCALTLASAIFYAEALYTLSHSSSSTAGLIFVVGPVLLAAVAAVAYGLIVILHSRSRKSKSAA